MLHNNTFDLTNVVDDRLKPQSLHRHKNASYEQYLTKHAHVSPNIIAAPFPTDESGRLKKTQVLDHIIKLKKNNLKRNENVKERKKIQNEATFVNYLLKKKALEKEEKR